MKNTLFLIITILSFIACDPSKKAVQKSKDKITDTLQQLEAVQKMMTGSFTSEAQSIADSTYFNISLNMVPIWGDEQNSKWLYVEQAATANLKKPYRQRVYQLSLMADGTIASKVYELPDPEKYIHAWENEKLFDQLTPASLVTREGCTVYLKPDENNCYSGSTKDQECLSSLRGATYATSVVSVCQDAIESWDQGWDAVGEQVWGATEGPYIFDRKNR